MKKTLALAAALAMLATAAIAAPKYTVGLVQLVEHPSLDEIRIAMLDELVRLGYGPETVEIDYQNGQNSPSLINTICQKFVSRNVDVIVPIATPTAQCAAAATDSIPIVFSAVSDPLVAGVVKNLDKPEANVTGVSNAINPADTLDLAEELTPGLKHYGIIFNTAESNSTNTTRKAEAEMTKRGLTYQEAVIASAAEVPAAINSLMGKVDAVFVPNDNTTATAMPLLSQIAIENKVPVYAAVDSLVRDGALGTRGISYTELGQITAKMVTEILNGAKVADTPVIVMRGSIVEINKDTAAALGVDVSKYVK